MSGDISLVTELITDTIICIIMIFLKVSTNDITPLVVDNLTHCKRIGTQPVDKKTSTDNPAEDQQGFFLINKTTSMGLQETHEDDFETNMLRPSLMVLEFT